MKSSERFTTKKMTVLALLSDIAVILCLLVRVPLVPSVSFLTYDPKDVAIGLAGFLYGPGSAAIVSAISSALELLFHGGNIIDWLMDFLGSASFICTASWIYQHFRTHTSAFAGLAAGIVVNIIVMVIWNYIMDPIYFGMAREAVVAMLPAIALFNLIKGMINTVLILVIYKPVSSALHAAGLVEKEKIQHGGKRTAAVVGIFVLVSFAVVLLAYEHLV